MNAKILIAALLLAISAVNARPAPQDDGWGSSYGGMDTYGGFQDDGSQQFPEDDGSQGFPSDSPQEYSDDQEDDGSYGYEDDGSGSGYSGSGYQGY